MAMSEEKPIAFYHVAAMHHWREVVNEQLGVLKRSGFDGKIFISFIGGRYEDGFLHHILGSYGFDYEIAFTSTNLHDYEFPALRLMERVCAAGHNGPVIYFHVKGVSKCGCWATTMWRWLMGAFVLARWRELYGALRDGKNVAGVAWSGAVPPFPAEHFAGTFWVTSGAFIRTLTPVDTYIKEFQIHVDHYNNAKWFSIRHGAECWINSRLTVVPAQYGPTSHQLWNHAWWVGSPYWSDVAANYPAGGTYLEGEDLPEGDYLLLGNGPAVVGAGAVGAAIDAFPGQVVRFNHCPAKVRGLGDLLPVLGARTDVWATAGAAPVADFGQGYNYLTLPPDMCPPESWGRLREAGGRRGACQLAIYEKVKAEMGAHPSSGALMAARLLALGRRVYLHGFDFMDDGRRHHYWEEGLRPTTDNHDGRAEKAWFSALLENPEVPLEVWAPGQAAPGAPGQAEHLVKMYRRLYASPKGDAYRGHAEELYLDLLRTVLVAVAPKTILEYGCGHSTLGLAAARVAGAALLRYDPALPEFAERPTGAVDLIITTDVLEHIPLPNIPEILDYPASYHFHAVCCRPACLVLEDGTNAHCTVRPPLWWRDYLTAHYGRGGRRVVPLPHPAPDIAVFLASPIRDPKP